MKPTIEIPAPVLKALFLLAAKNDIRYYLNGVYVEVSEQAGILLAATNGHYLGIIRLTPDYRGPSLSLILPGTLAADLKPAKNAPYWLDLEALTIQDATGKHAFEPINGKFPDFRQVVPTHVSGEMGHFNPEYIGLFAKVWRTLHQAKADQIPNVTLLHNGTQPAVVDLHYPDSAFLLMSWRDKGYAPDKYTAPDWSTTRVPGLKAWPWATEKSDNPAVESTDLT